MKDSSSASAVPGAARIAHLETELKQAKVKISAVINLFNFQTYKIAVFCVLCVYFGIK